MIKNIYKGYEYLFYKFYSWDVWLNCGKDPFPYQAAWYTLSFLVYMNFLAILMILEIFTGYGFDQIGYSGYQKIIVIALGFSFLILNYFIFIRKKIYQSNEKILK